MLLTIGKTYNFVPYPIPILGVNFSEVTVLSIMDYSVAIKFDNIEHLQKESRPFLPQGSVTDPKKYTYYLLKDSDGNQRVVAEEWINPASVQEISSTNYVITVQNVTSTKLSAIQDQLRLLGVTFTVDATV